MEFSYIVFFYRNIAVQVVKASFEAVVFGEENLVFQLVRKRVPMFVVTSVCPAERKVGLLIFGFCRM